MTTPNLRKTVDALQTRMAVVRETVAKEKEALTLAKAQEESIKEAQDVAQRIAQTIQQEAHRQIAGVVSRCLEAIFDDPYEFIIEFERKRNKTEATLAFRRGPLTLDPRTGVGGAVVDVAAFALRLAALVLARPPLRRVLVLDEPFKNVSAMRLGHRLRALLEALSKEMGIQFIIVTHMDEIRAGKVVEIE